MSAQLDAKYTAVRAVAFGFSFCVIVLAASSLGGCLRTDPPLIGGDPADPGAKVAATGYRSTTAPYTRMRPSSPAASSDKGATAPKTER